MVERLDCVVVGAGVVGLAVARSLAMSGREVVVLEKEPVIGAHASSRNSEVIHAGLYYPRSSNKARLCVRGRKLLYRYCREKGVPHKQKGKLVVATDAAQRDKLDRLKMQAEINGVAGLSILTADDVAKREPAIDCVAALFSPATGIIDSQALMLALQADIESAGGTVLVQSCVTAAAAARGGFEFVVSGQGFRCRTLINAAGLWAAQLAESIHGGAGTVPAAVFAKGHYFAYQGKSPFSHLVYPLPSAEGLGIHATVDLSGAVRFGPDVTWVDEIDYAFEESRKPLFVAAIRPYFPDLDGNALVPAYTGIRPKLYGPGEAPADFVIQGETGHGIPGLVDLLGIESPGLTASLAIGEHVAGLLGGR